MFADQSRCMIARHYPRYARVLYVLCCTLHVGIVSIPSGADACEQPLYNHEIADAASRAYFALTRADDERVNQIVDEIFLQIECAAEILSAKDLAMLLYYRGLAEAQRGNIANATLTYTQALSIYPLLQWNDTFSPKDRQIFDAAAAQIQSAGTATINVRMKTGSTLAIDGKKLSEYTNLRVACGLHIVQSLRDDTIMGTMLVSATLEDSISLEVGDIERTRGIQVNARVRKVALTSSMTVAALGIASAVVGAVAANHSLGQWDSGEYETSLVAKNHRGLVVAGIGFSLALLGSGTGLSLALLTYSVPESAFQFPITHMPHGNTR